MKNIHLFTGILFLLISAFGQSQTEITVRDFETWSMISANKTFAEKFEIDLGQSLRLKDNSSEVDQYFTDLSLGFKPTKFMSFAAGVRFIGDNDGDEYENHLRFNGDVNFKHSVNRFKFKYRIRLQSKNELGYSRDEGDFLKNSFRLRAGAKYDIKGWKLDPEFSGEIFRESGKYMVSSFNKYRLSLSTKYKFNKLIELKAFYRFERGLGSLLPESTNIVGFNLMFNL